MSGTTAHNHAPNAPQTPRSPASHPHDADLATPGVRREQVKLTDTSLGRGSFGSVWRGSFSGCAVAVKVCSVAPSASANSLRSAAVQFRREMKRYTQLRHPCITQFFCVVQDRTGRLLLVTELMKGGSLYEAIGHLRRAGVTRLAPEGMIRIAQHITNGLCYLHACHFSFGDLKSMNVLLSERPDIARRTFTESAQAKLCDFGLSRNLKGVINQRDPSASLSHSYVARRKGPTGTFAYLAPEAFSGLPLDDPDAPKAADVYALGIVLWELATISRPWPGKKALQLIRIVGKDGRRPEWPESAVDLPEGFVELVESCWHQDPKQRPTADEVARRLDAMYDELPCESPTWSFVKFRPRGQTDEGSRADDGSFRSIEPVSLSHGLEALEVEEVELPVTPVPLGNANHDSAKDLMACSAASNVEKIHLSVVTGSSHTDMHQSPQSIFWSSASGPPSLRTDDEGKPKTYQLPPTPQIMSADIERELRLLEEEEQIDLSNIGISMNSRPHFQ